MTEVSESLWSPSYYHNFRFIPGKTWFASAWTPVFAISAYLATLAVLKKWIAHRGPFNLKKILIVHNLTLSIASGVLLVALVSHVLTLTKKYTFFDVICDEGIQLNYGLHYFLYYLNYLSKYYEFIDTFLLALRGRPTPFLHVYHHAATAALAWSQLQAQICIQWLPVIINLSIHLVMYTYFALHAAGYRFWWKRYLTMAQVLQFFAVVLVGAVLLFSRVMGEMLGFERFPVCHGTYTGSVIGLGVMLSYLYLFSVLYKDLYKKPKITKDVAPQVTSRGAKPKTQ